MNELKIQIPVTKKSILQIYLKIFMPFIVNLYQVFLKSQKASKLGGKIIAKPINTNS